MFVTITYDEQLTKYFFKGWVTIFLSDERNILAFFPQKTANEEIMKPVRSIVRENILNHLFGHMISYSI